MSSTATFELYDKAAATTEVGVVERLVDVHLSEADYDAVLSTKQDFGKVVNFLVSSYAQGGIMIQPSKVAYLTETTGLPFATQNDVVEMVENAVMRGSAAGDLRVIVDVDPAFAPALEDLAYAQGRTVNEIVKETVDVCLTNSWIAAVMPSGGIIPLLAEQRSALERVMGKNITSESLVEWVTSEARREKKESKIVKLKKEE